GRPAPAESPPGSCLRPSARSEAPSAPSARLQADRAGADAATSRVRRTTPGTAWAKDRRGRRRCGQSVPTGIELMQNRHAAKRLFAMRRQRRSLPLSPLFTAAYLVRKERPAVAIAPFAGAANAYVQAG